MHSNISRGFHQDSQFSKSVSLTFVTLSICQFVISFHRQHLSTMLQPSIHWLQCTLLAFLICSIIDFVATQDACVLPYPGPRVITSVLVVKQTIHVITNIPRNTAFEVNPDLTISVDNAPTNLDFTTTYFSRNTSVITIAG